MKTLHLSFLILSAIFLFSACEKHIPDPNIGEEGLPEVENEPGVRLISATLAPHDVRQIDLKYNEEGHLESFIHTSNDEDHYEVICDENGRILSMMKGDGGDATAPDSIAFEYIDDRLHAYTVFVPYSQGYLTDKRREFNWVGNKIEVVYAYSANGLPQTFNLLLDANENVVEVQNADPSLTEWEGVMTYDDNPGALSLIPQELRFYLEINPGSNNMTSWFRTLDNGTSEERWYEYLTGSNDYPAGGDESVYENIGGELIHVDNIKMFFEYED